MAFERHIQTQEKTFSIATEADLVAALATFPSIVAADVTLSIAGTRQEPALITSTGSKNIQKTIVPGNYIRIVADNSAWSGVLTPAGGGANFITVAKGSLGWAEGNWYNTGTGVGAAIIPVWTTLDRVNNPGKVYFTSVGITETAANGSAGTGYWKITSGTNFADNMGDVSNISNFRWILCAARLEATTNATDLLLLNSTGSFEIKNFYAVGRINCGGTSGRPEVWFYDACLNGYYFCNSGKSILGRGPDNAAKTFAVLNGRVSSGAGCSLTLLGTNSSGGGYLVKCTTSSVLCKQGGGAYLTWVYFEQCGTATATGIVTAETNSNAQVYECKIGAYQNYSGFLCASGLSHISTNANTYVAGGWGWNETETTGGRVD